MDANTMDALGLSEPGKIFKAGWEDHGFHAFKRHGEMARTTITIQDMFKDASNVEKHFFQKKLQAVMEKRKEIKKDAIDSGLLEDSVPILFDPEILQILRDEAPFVARLPTEGWDGYTVVANRIDDWDEPLGFVDEAGSIDMSGADGKRFTINKLEEKMKIFYDKVVISDFTRKAGDFHMPVRETSLGARISAHARWKEQSILYGKPDEALTDGSPGSANAYKGLSVWLPTTDKSGFDTDPDKAVIQDIKKEIADLMQTAKGISKADMEIWTSWSMLDFLQNQVDVSERIQIGEPGFNYGFETVRIMGIPVIASHNVAEHTYNDGTDTYVAGTEGDVFLVNKRSYRYRALAPLSVIPLARIGLAEQSALYEFGTTIERSNGQWGKYLTDYQI